MIKPRFEIFRKNATTLGVVAKDSYVFNRLQELYCRYPKDAVFVPGEEVLFWVPEVSQSTLMKILDLQSWPGLIE